MQDSQRRKIQKKNAGTRSDSPLVGKKYSLPKNKKRLTLRDQFAILKTILNRKTMIEKLKKTELWVAVGASALLTLFTQIGLDPALAAKLIAAVTSAYIGSRGVAKLGAASTK